jgi:transketolase
MVFENLLQHAASADAALQTLSRRVKSEEDAATLCRLRRTILETSANAGEGHIASAFSILEIVWTLYDRVMYPPLFSLMPHDTRARLVPGDEKRDRFLLSKGHGCLALYAVLAERNYFPAEQLSSFCQPGAMLQGHPSRDIPGVECSTGSLGHGAAISVGMARALQIAGNPARVFCLVGDTENEEGSVFEAMHLASRFKLDNLTWIIDANGTSPNGIDGEPFLTSLAAKYQAFGWFVSEIDGHDCDAIERALKPTGGGKPFVVIAETQKGRGCPAMEADPQAWHRRAPKPGIELENLIASLR